MNSNLAEMEHAWIVFYLLLLGYKIIETSHKRNMKLRRSSTLECVWRRATMDDGVLFEYKLKQLNYGCLFAWVGQMGHHCLR